MVSSLLKGLAEEKIILLKPSKTAGLPFPLKGIIRLVDEKGRTLGLVLDKDVLEELEEDAEAQNPEFIASLQESRKSGRVTSKTVKKKSGIK